MSEGAESESWQRRYQAGKARDDARSAVWVRKRFGGSVGRTLLEELPLFAAMAVVGLITLGWQAAVFNVALLLVVVLGFRAWARRRYDLGPVADPTPRTDTDGG